KRGSGEWRPDTVDAGERFEHGDVGVQFAQQSAEAVRAAQGAALERGDQAAVVADRARLAGVGAELLPDLVADATIVRGDRADVVELVGGRDEQHRGARVAEVFDV